MRKAGDVTYADAHKNRKNEGVVEFASRRDMERAIDKFDDYDLNGRRIKVSLLINIVVISICRSDCPSV